MNKTIKFGLYGAVGCLLAAIAGEGFLSLTRDWARPAESEPPTRVVCLLIDCSGSMRNGKLEEVRRAATQFARRQDLSRDSIAVVGFGSGARVWTGLSGNLDSIEQACDKLSAQGSTAMNLGIMSAQETLADAPGEPTILMFTDGMPALKDRALQAARACREAGVRIVAVATGDADTGFLAKITDDSNLVFRTESGSYGDAFEIAEKIIYAAPNMVESSGAVGDISAGVSSDQLVPTMIRTGGWTALLSLGIAIALIIAQNRRLRRRFLRFDQARIAVPGSMLAGLIAGAAAQFLFLQATRYPALDITGRVAAWMLLGALLGRGMAFIVPNLGSRRAWIGGAIGGALGAGGFIWSAMGLGELVDKVDTEEWAGVVAWSDVAARLSGATILGLAMGLMIGLADAVFRDAWLEIDYGNREIENVALGPTPVSIGSDDSRCTVYARDADPVACLFRLDGDTIFFEDAIKHSVEPIRAGEKRSVGNITVTVCASSQ